DTRQGDESASVFGPALEDGEIQQREIVALDDFLARTSRNSLRKKLPHLREHGKHFYFIEEALRGFHVHKCANTVGDFVEGFDVQGQLHAAVRPELVDQNLGSRMSFDVLEKKSGTTGLASRRRLFPRILADAIGDLCDLEDGIYVG